VHLKARNTAVRTDTMTRTQPTQRRYAMLAKLFLSIGSCCRGDHDCKRSSGGCVTMAVDMGRHGESVGGGGAVQEVNVERLRRQPHSAKFWPMSHLQARFVARGLQLRRW